jgi:hypothetical protein
MAQNVKTILGVPIANVKTFCGVPIANCKTIMGVDNTGGGPTLVAQDNFDAYTTGVDLASTADWSSPGGGPMNVFKLTTDGSVCSGGASVCCAYWSADAFNADQRSEITIDATSAGGSFDDVGPAVRCQSGAITYYAAVFTAGDLRLISVVSGGSPTIIIQDNAMSLVAGNRIAIEASGAGTATRLKVQIDTGSGWVDKWTDQNPAADIDGGSAGVANFSQSGSTCRLDDWFGYDL